MSKATNDIATEKALTANVRKPPKKIRLLQDEFFKSCIESSQTLDEILDDLGIPHQTLAGWLMHPHFRVRLHGMRRYMRRARDLQIEMGAFRASAVLNRAVSNPASQQTQPVARSACVDLVRLARDSRTRVRANDPHVDDVTKRRSLYHPGVPEEEARELIEELARRDAVTAPSPS